MDVIIRNMKNFINPTDILESQYTIAYHIVSTSKLTVKPFKCLQCNVLHSLASVTHVYIVIVDGSPVHSGFDYAKAVDIYNNVTLN